MPDAAPAPRTGLLKYTGTPEEQQQATDMYLHGLVGLPIGAASQAIPPVAATHDWSNWRDYVPGLPSYLYSGAAGLTELAGNAALRAGNYIKNQVIPVTPTEAPQFTVPGHEAAQQMNEEAVKAALKIIPHPEPTTEAGKIGQDIGISMGQGTAGVLPELRVGGLPGTILKYAAPPPGAAGIGAAMGGVSGALVSPEGGPTLPTPLNDDGTPFKPAPISDATPTSSKLSLISSAEAATPAKSYPGDAMLPKPLSDTGEPITPPWETKPAQPALRPGAARYANDGQTNIPAWEWGLGTVGAAALLWGAAKYGPRSLNSVADLVRGNLTDATEANRALHTPAFRTGLDPNIEMPLPNNAGGMTRQWAEKWYNPNAVLNEYVKAPEVSATPAIADAKIATNEMINNPANANRRMEGLFRSGIEEGTGHKFPVMVDYRQAVDNLNPGQKKLADLGAWYASELNIRDQNIQAGRAQGILPTPANDFRYRVSYPEIATDDLRNAVMTARSDPQVADFLDRNRAVQMSVVDSYERRGLITPQQATYSRTNYSDFMPTIGADGEYMHAWDAKIRDPGSGYTKPPAPAWEAMEKHFGNSIQTAQREDWVRGYILDRWNAQQANPALAEIVTERAPATRTVTPLETPTAPSALKRSITVQTAAGPRTFDINSTAFYRALTGGPQQMALHSGIASGIRNTVTNASTGPLGTLMGSPFVAKTVIRDLALIPAQAKSGMWRGQLDRLTGMRLPYDPTFISGSAATMAKDSATVITKHVADMLGNHDNVFAAPLRAMFGHGQVDSWVSSMRAQMEKSALAYREAHGVGTGGNRSLLNMQPGITDKGGYFRDPTAHTVAPMLNHPNFKLIPDRVPLPNFLRAGVNNTVRGAAGSVMNLNSLVRELYGVIADAPHSYLHDLNLSNPKFTPRTLANAVQTVTGNPGTRGSGVLAQKLAANVPFYNTTIQAGGASLAALRDHPIAMGTTVATVMATYALAEHLSALLSGKEHVDHLENKLSNSVQAHNATIYHGPGTDPNNHTEIPLPSEWGWLWPYMSAITGHAIGTWNAHSNDDTLSRLTHTLAGMFDHHVSTDTVQQTAVGGTSAFVPGDVTPMISAAVSAATGGQQVRNVPEQLVTNIVKGQPWLSNMTTGGGPQHNTPGQEGSDGMLLRADSGVLKAVMNAFGGAFGTAWDLGHNFSERTKIDPTWKWAWDGLGRDYRQQWEDHTRFANSVWQKNLQQSTFGPLEERTNQMWQNTAKLANVNSDIKAEGFSGMRRGVPLMVTGDSPVPKIGNPQMRDLYMRVAETGKQINREIMPREHQIRAQMDNLKNAPFMPDEKRRLQNQLSEQLYQVVTQKHKMLLDMNSRLSQVIGGRHFDIAAPIDWQGTVDQFHY